MTSWWLSCFSATCLEYHSLLRTREEWAGREGTGRQARANGCTKPQEGGNGGKCTAVAFVAPTALLCC